MIKKKYKKIVFDLSNRLMQGCNMREICNTQGTTLQRMQKLLY